MNLPDTTTNLSNDEVSKNPGLAGRTAQSGSLLGVLEPQDDLSPPIKALLTNVVQGLRRDWLASSALRWDQLYPISELANTRLEKHITSFLRELFCSYSQLIGGIEMHLLQIEQGGVVREEALLRLKQLVIHPRDLASYQCGIAHRQRVAADINSGLEGRSSSGNE